jgi:ribosomal-protein-alanine N-acetyltransferase
LNAEGHPHRGGGLFSVGRRVWRERQRVSVNYRLFRPEDFAALYAIEEVCFQPPHRFGRSYVRQLVWQANAAAWVAEDNGRLTGFGIMEWSDEPEGVVAYVQTLEVLPEARGQGVGRELLRRMEESARGAGAAVAWLHVDAENEGAIRVYERAGYRVTGREPDYYGRGRAGLVHMKPLSATKAG